MEDGDAMETKRAERMDGVTRNCCGFIAAIDAVVKSDWLREIDIKGMKYPGLVRILKEENGASYKQAIK